MKRIKKLELTGNDVIEFREKNVGKIVDEEIFLIAKKVNEIIDRLNKEEVNNE